MVLAVLAPALLAGCGSVDRSAADKALDNATTLARADVEKARSVLEQSLRTFAAPERARAEAAGHIPSFGRVTVAGSTVAGGEVQLDVVAIDWADGTDGFSHAGSMVRICARLAGRPGRDATATKADRPCPADAPTAVPSIGSVTTTVPLEP